MPSHAAQSVEITEVLPPSLDTDAYQWVFGYGSLMWRPDFDFAHAVPARVFGWHRRFTLLSVKAWGTLERPGLSAAIHPGGSVLGLAFAISQDTWAHTRSGLDKREAAYMPQTVDFQYGSRNLKAHTYVVHPKSARFLIDPDFDTQARHILQGDGPRGTSLEYLQKTVAMLDKLGSGGTQAHKLLSHVEATAR